MQQSQIEQIKNKLRIFLQRCDKNIKGNSKSLSSIKEDECARDFVLGKIAARTQDNSFFKAFFADELKTPQNQS